MTDNKVCVIAMGINGSTPFAAYVLFDSVQEAYSWMLKEPRLQLYRVLEILPGNTSAERAHAQKRLEFWRAMES